MSATVANPITFYGDWSNTVVDQSGQSGDLYNYYWTSYSRGTDGKSGAGQVNASNWHNLYLDSYIPLRHKSIYDPCPYGYRIPSNGTYNHFTNTGWTQFSYTGGAILNTSWYTGLGDNRIGFSELGNWFLHRLSTASSSANAYTYGFSSLKEVRINQYNWPIFWAQSVRCIEECELKIRR